eukprot:SAG22_NODE_549_length_9239_cov_7.477899_6_plen_185_part_00
MEAPKWYNQGPIECIDAMESAFSRDEIAAFCRINAFKYVWRCTTYKSKDTNTHPIGEVVKEIRRQARRPHGGGHGLRVETREAINYGGDIGYVVDQNGRSIDIGRGIDPDSRGLMFDDTVPERIISETNRPLKFKRGDLPAAEIKRIMDAKRPERDSVVALSCEPDRDPICIVATVRRDVPTII